MKRVETMLDVQKLFEHHVISFLNISNNFHVAGSTEHFECILQAMCHLPVQTERFFLLFYLLFQAVTPLWQPRRKHIPRRRLLRDNLLPYLWNFFSFFSWFVFRVCFRQTRPRKTRPTPDRTKMTRPTQKQLIAFGGSASHQCSCFGMSPGGGWITS